MRQNKCANRSISLLSVDFPAEKHTIIGLGRNARPAATLCLAKRSANEIEIEIEIEIESVATTGHQSLQEVERYTRTMQPRKLADSEMKKLRK